MCRLNVFDIVDFFAEIVNVFRPLVVFAEELCPPGSYFS